jgi:RNA 2',3'-cyclic 3'-phosphodiesterase
MARLFVAVWPPDEVVTELMTLGRKDRRGVRFVHPERWHVTLRFLGECDPAAAGAALDATELPAARARLGPAVDVLAERVLIVPVGGVEELAAAVTAATAALGEPPRRRFSGHLTLARLDRRARSLPTTLGMLVSAEFDVPEITLVQSRRDHRGVRYETLASWPVAAAPSTPG